MGIKERYWGWWIYIDLNPTLLQQISEKVLSLKNFFLLYCLGEAINIE